MPARTNLVPDYPQEARTSGKTGVVVLKVVVLPDGAVRRIKTTTHFAHDDQGAPVRGSGISQDVTEDYEREEQLRQSQRMDVLGQLVDRQAWSGVDRLALHRTASCQHVGWPLPVVVR